MRWHDVFVTGIGSQLGDRVTVEAALTAGDCDDSALQTRQKAISVSHLTGPDLAVRAARRAISSATQRVGEPVTIGPHFHSSIFDRGVEFWSTSSYVRDNAIGAAGTGVTIGLDAMSNSLVAAIEIAAASLSSRPERSWALLTAGDAFGGSCMPHWTSDVGVIYGDAGSAMVLGREPAFAQVLSTASWSDPGLEGMHRGDLPLSRPHCVKHASVNLRQRRKEWLNSADRVSIDARNAVGVTETVKVALYDAGCDLDAVRWVLLPHYGESLLHDRFLGPLGLPADRTVANLGAEIGHCGASDQVIGLDHLASTYQIDRGDLVLILGAGAGMTWTAAVLRIL